MENLLLTYIDLIYYENKFMKATNKYEKVYWWSKVLKVRRNL